MSVATSESVQSVSAAQDAAVASSAANESAFNLFSNNRTARAQACRAAAEHASAVSGAAELAFGKLALAFVRDGLALMRRDIERAELIGEILADGWSKQDVSDALRFAALAEFIGDSVAKLSKHKRSALYPLLSRDDCERYSLVPNGKGLCETAVAGDYATAKDVKSAVDKLLGKASKAPAVHEASAENRTEGQQPPVASAPQSTEPSAELQGAIGDAPQVSSSAPVVSSEASPLDSANGSLAALVACKDTAAAAKAFGQALAGSKQPKLIGSLIVGIADYVESARADEDGGQSAAVLFTALAVAVAKQAKRLQASGVKLGKLTE
jgi:hypothetical protein